MNCCGDCLHYSTPNGSPFCRKTGKVTGHLLQKDCFTPKINTQMETTNEQPKTKVCKRCGRELPLHEFGRHARTADGLQTYCRECCAASVKRARKKKADKKVLEVMHVKDATPLIVFTNQELLDEIKRRGYTGYLKHVEEISL